MSTEPREIPSDEWARIKPGSRVRVEYNHGAGRFFRDPFVAEGTWHDIDGGIGVTHNAAHVFLLEEAPDPDADLIERIAARMYEDENEGRVAWADIPPTSSAPGVWKRYAATALAVVRESEVSA